MTDHAKPSAATLIKSAEQAIKTSRGLPPIHLWHPPLSGDLDMRIARDGQWYYQGSSINRIALVRLFSTILRREDDDYYLVTPVEKWRIQVDLAPFIAISLKVEHDARGQTLTFATNVGDSVIADAQHPLRVEVNPENDEPKPFVLVRNGLEALVSRNVFYQLVENAQERQVNKRQVLGVESAGQFFVLG